MRELSPEQKTNRRRILEITHEVGGSHIGSAFTVVDILDAIYQVKKPEEKVVLSAGHSAAALYVILEKYGLLPKADLTKLHAHPDRNPDIGIDVSTGSLGQGLPIAAGMAMGAKDRDVYCVVTDGEMAEGSMWEALWIANQQNTQNLKVIVNANGWGAYDKIDTSKLRQRMSAFGWSVWEVDGHDTERIKEVLNLYDTARSKYQHRIAFAAARTIVLARTNVNQLSFLEDQDAHYHTMTDEEYKKGMEELK